ncbi:MAK10-like protein [Tanacetum coccineum]
MKNENPHRTLGDYSKPSDEGYRNTTEIPDRNTVVPLRSGTIRLVQNGCSFHLIRFEDPNQHFKDFLKLMDLLDLNVDNRERTRLPLFQFSLRDQASNWLKRLPAGSISTWEDLTNCFLAQFFPPGMTFKLCNDILMFQQHQGESLSEAWTRFKDLLQKVPHRAADGKLHDKNDEESWALLEDLALYDNESWNDPRDFAKPVKAISMPQDVPNTSDRRLVKLENKVQRLMQAYLAPNQPIQVNKITYSCEISSGPYETQYCMENTEQAFIDYASSRINEARGLLEETKDVLGLTDRTKSYPIEIMKNVEVNVGKLKLFEDFHIVDMEREPTCPLLVGRGFLVTSNAIIDCKRESYKPRTSEDDIGVRPPYFSKRDFRDNHLPEEWEIARDAEVNPFKDILVFRKMVEFLGTIPINLKINMWESEEVIFDEEKPGSS